MIKTIMKKTSMLILLFILSIFIVSAHGEETFTEAEKIIDSKVSCDQLTDEQLEIIGDYYMEQMHPGEAHEVMDERMGGEGSESLRQMHIQMARNFYCGEHEAMDSGMMNMMMGRGMMGSADKTMFGGEKMAYGMMGSGTFGMAWIGAIYFVIVSFIFSVIFWLTHNWLVKDKKKR